MHEEVRKEQPHPAVERLREATAELEKNGLDPLLSVLADTSPVSKSALSGIPQAGGAASVAVPAPQLKPHSFIGIRPSSHQVAFETAPEAQSEDELEDMPSLPPQATDAPQAPPARIQQSAPSAAEDSRKVPA